MPDGSMRALLQPLHRIRVLSPYPGASPLEAHVEALDEVLAGDVEEQALAYHLLSQFVTYVDRMSLPEPLKQDAREQQAHPAVLSDLIASTLPGATREIQLGLLAEPNVRTRLQELTALLGHELATLEMGQKIQNQVQEELGQHQRQHILREQLRAIQRELGESDSGDSGSLRARLESARLPEAAYTEAIRELDRLESMSAGASEASVSRTYLDWILAMPWNKRSAERTDLERARRVLDEDHEGVHKVKERILEYVAVRAQAPGSKGDRSWSRVAAGRPPRCWQDISLGASFPGCPLEASMMKRRFVDTAAPMWARCSCRRCVRLARSIQ